MAKLLLDDGTVIRLSNEAIQEIQKAFQSNSKQEKIRQVKVWRFRAEPYMADEGGEFYKIGLTLYTPEVICNEHCSAVSRAFSKNEIREIIRGLQELIS